MTQSETKSKPKVLQYPSQDSILRRGLSTVGHTGTYATGDLPSWAVGVNLLSNGESLNVESAAL